MLANSIVSWLHELLLRSGSESWEWPGELYNLLVTKPQPCCKVGLTHTWMIYSSDGHKKGPLKYFKDVLQTVKRGQYETQREDMDLPDVGGRVQSMETKVCAVAEVPEHRQVTELSSFLGLVNYYGKFLPNLANTAAPLYNLLLYTPEEFPLGLGQGPGRM